MEDRGVTLVGDVETFLKRATHWLLNRRPLKNLRDWAITFSLWPVHFTTACCGAEIATTSAPRFDAERWGYLPFAGPRQCNLLIVEGTLSKKMARAAKYVYDQMPEPKFVIAMGACAISGGIFWNSYNIVRAHEILPVDVFIPGCPPRPEAVIRSILMLRDKIRRELVFHEERG